MAAFFENVEWHSKETIHICNAYNDPTTLDQRNQNYGVVHRLQQEKLNSHLRRERTPRRPWYAVPVPIPHSLSAPQLLSPTRA